MQMGLVDIVYIFFLAVSGAAHVSDHVSGLYDIPLLQSLGIRPVLPQVGRVVISLFLLDTAIVLLVSRYVLTKAKVFRFLCGIPEKVG